MPRPKLDISAAQVRIILEFYAQGHGLQWIRKQVGYSVDVLRRIVQENGLTINRVGRPFKK
jgi:hypothetical protein